MIAKMTTLIVTNAICKQLENESIPANAAVSFTSNINPFDFKSIQLGNIGTCLIGHESKAQCPALHTCRKVKVTEKGAESLKFEPVELNK